MGNMFSRRSVVAQIGAASLLGASRSHAAAPQWRAKQYHNQPEGSTLHKALVQTWSAVRDQTGGRLEVEVFAENNKLPGSDPAALKLLQSGGLEFFTLMGGLLSQAVPAMDVQGLPFVFQSPDQVYKLDDGPLGRLLDEECEQKGIHRLRHGLFENGMRQINMREKAIRNVEDLTDARIRVPAGEMFRDFFQTIGARPTTLNVNQMYQALKDGTVDGQENPLVVIENFKLFEVTKHVSMTNHIWSGFNMIANGEFWHKLPGDVRSIVERNVAQNVDAQRRTTDARNERLEVELLQNGMQVNTADAASFRKHLAGAFYPRWKNHLGARTWSALEEAVGKIG